MTEKIKMAIVPSLKKKSNKKNMRFIKVVSQIPVFDAVTIMLQCNNNEKPFCFFSRERVV